MRCPSSFGNNEKSLARCMELGWAFVENPERIQRFTMVCQDDRKLVQEGTSHGVSP
jgi:hypothetical protein